MKVLLSRCGRLKIEIPWHAALIIFLINIYKETGYVSAGDGIAPLSYRYIDYRYGLQLIFPELIGHSIDGSSAHCDLNDNSGLDR